MRDLIEEESRTSAQLAKLRKEAERHHRQAGFLTTAADTERRRLDWVQAGAGQSRHQSERARWAGPTYTPSPRLSASAWWPMSAGTFHVSIVRTGNR
jgi:hypothetical protein